MPVSSSGAEPEGFKVVLRSNPHRSSDGQLVGAAPFTVEYDGCSSTAGTGQALHFYFDWDFDHRANVSGTRDACRQKHTYVPDPDQATRRNLPIVTNICVTSGALGSLEPAPYVSCREFTIVLPTTPAPELFCHPINTGTGAVCPGSGTDLNPTEFCVEGPIRSTDSENARAACETCFGVGECHLQGNAQIGAFYEHLASATWFYFKDATTLDCMATPRIARAGDILNGSTNCPAGTWAP